ncbi:MAG: NAD-dependent epimerase/dehydratase family protein [Firmicutes bacterium]|nr:NAD-dependent epimerase/dehydratase family protein [Bacillota bacterium]
MDKTIYVVTGATGFVGCNLIPKLIQQGKTVHALARSEEKAAKALPDTAAKVFYGDIRDKAALEQLFCETDAEYRVIHTAAVVLIGGNRREHAIMRDVNINGVKNVIECCLAHNARLLHVSSVHAIPELKKRALMHEVSAFDPKKVKGAYAKSKAEGSALVLDAVANKGLQAAMVHPSGIVGPNDYGNSHLTQLAADYMAGKIPAATKGGYDFVDVRDVCDGIIAAEENFVSGECYLLSNRYYPIKDVMDMLHEITGLKKLKKVLPIWVAKLGLPFLSLAAKIKKTRPLYTGYSLYTLKSNSNYSHEKATRELQYNPRDIKESLSETVEFLQNNSTL